MKFKLIGKHDPFPIIASVSVLIIALAIGYYLVIFLPSKEVEPKLLLDQRYCTEDAVSAVNWLINGEQIIFGKARAVVALKNHPCLEDYPLLIERATSLVEKEKNRVESVDELVKLEQNIEEIDRLKLELKTDIELFETELEKRAMKELEKLLED